MDLIIHFDTIYGSHYTIQLALFFIFYFYTFSKMFLVSAK